MSKIIKFLIVSLLSLTVLSCEKECNCGIVTDDGIDSDPNTFENYYWVVIKNDCSGNYKKFYLTQSDWYDAIVGEPFCITNVDSWKVLEKDLIESDLDVQKIKYMSPDDK